MSCWWTTTESDLGKHRELGHPCDPRGGRVNHTDNVDAFIADQRRRAEAGFFGPLGLTVLMAAYHGNIVVEPTDEGANPESIETATCLATWREVGDLLAAAGYHQRRPSFTSYYFERSGAGERIINRMELSEGELHAVNPRFDLRNHSPTGFEWGYGGSGPAQAALAILADYIGDPRVALRHYQRFKSAIIAAHRENAWVLEGVEIDRFMATERGETA